MSPFFYSYLITDPDSFGDTLETLQNSLENSFKNHHIDMICFRDKQTDDIYDLAKLTLEISKKHNVEKVLINGNIELALELGFDGVHLTSNQFDKIEYAKQNNLFVMISCHTDDEVKLAKSKGANGITYSPIFYKENKGAPKGCEELANIVKTYQDDSFNVFALGGIVSHREVSMIKQTYAAGFASIRYFID